VRHFVYRTYAIRTTWKLRAGLPVTAAVVAWLTAGWWTVSIGESLVCDASIARSEAILLENFGPNDLLFERARQLRDAQISSRVLVPIWTQNGSELNRVALHTAEAMATSTGLGTIEMVPVNRVEPITLNTARAVQRYLEREKIGSVIVLTELFRSRRSELVYEATLVAAGIRVHCQPVEGSFNVKTWPREWHGVQEVAEQWLKLQYYRFYAVPFDGSAT
jgi:hypothetical protein